MEYEKDELTPFHYPGTMFLGPGTRIVSNLFNNIQPTSFADSIARQHDIDYLMGEKYASAADQTAIRSALNTDFQSMVLKTGLRARQFLGLNFAKPYKNFSQQEMLRLNSWANSKISK